MGSDGKTPMERIRGRRGRSHMAEFGESVMYFPLRGDLADKRRAKIEMEPRFRDGVFLGLTHRSDEIIIWGQEGIRKARTIRRRPDAERFDAKQLLAACGTPLQPNPGENDTRIRTRMEPGVAINTTIGDPITKQDVSRELGEQRPFYMLKKDVKAIAKAIGYTPGCKGCRAVELGFTSRPPHTEECRKRFEPEMAKTARGSSRMETFERKLAEEVENRVL